MSDNQTDEEVSFDERYKEIGYKIAYCRKHLNLTQEQLAEKVGVSRQHIGAIEAPNVNRKISLDLIFNIADLCGIEPSWFLEYQSMPSARKSKLIEETNCLKD